MKIEDAVHLYAGAPKIIADLLAELQPYKAEDYPRTCGACGTPAACCDTDCMTAAHMAQHDGAIHRAKNWLLAAEKYERGNKR